MPKLELNLLCYPVAFYAGQKLNFKGRQPLALLAFLAMQAHPVSRARATQLLFDDDPECKARFRRRLSELKKSLRDVGCEHVLICDSKGLSLAKNVVVTDVQRFRLAVQEKNSSDGLTEYRKFLQGFDLDAQNFKKWLTEQRSELVRGYQQLLRQLSQDAVKHEKWDVAEQYLAKYLELEPFDESIHLAYLESLTKQEKRDEAKRYYQQYCKRLTLDLNSSPHLSFQTRVNELLNTCNIHVDFQTFSRLARDVAELVCIFDKEISTSILLGILECAEKRLMEACEELEQQGLLQVGTRGYTLAHDDIANIILEQMSASRMQFWHRKVVDFFSEQKGSSERILHHAKKAGLWQVVLKTAEETAQEARQQGQRQKAADFESLVLEALEHLENTNQHRVNALLKREEDYFIAGQRQAQQDDLAQLEPFAKTNNVALLYRQARYLKPSNPQQAELLLRQALVFSQKTEEQLKLKLELSSSLMYQNVTDEARQVVNDVIQEAEAKRFDDWQLKGLFSLAHSYALEAAVTEARAVLECSKPLIRDDVLSQAHYFHLLAKTYQRHSTTLELRTYAQQAHRLFKQLEHLRGQADSLQLIALAACHELQAPRAFEALRQAEAHYQRLGDVKQRLNMKANEGYLHTYLACNYQAAYGVFEHVYHEARQLKMPLPLGSIVNNMAAICNKLGELEKSERFLQQNLALRDKHTGLRTLAVKNQATTKRLRGQFHESLDYSYDASQNVPNDDYMLPELLTDIALSHLAVDNKTQALDTIRRSEPLLSQHQGQHFLVFAAKALIHHRLQDVHERQRALGQAQDALSYKLETLNPLEQKRLFENDAAARFIHAAGEGAWQDGEYLLR